MRVEASKRLIAMNVAVVAAEQNHANIFCLGLSVLLDVPEHLPTLKAVAAAQTGGAIDPKRNTVHKVVHEALTLALAQGPWSFELYFTALTPAGADAFKLAGAKALPKASPAEAARLELDVYVPVTRAQVGGSDPAVYLHPVLVTCARRLQALRQTLITK